jgi:ribosomal-protein-alanine N-acetyltransferase
MIFLETERLVFRTHEAADEGDFVRMHTDPEVRRYMGGQGVSGWPVEKALERFKSQYLGKPTETYGLWATILKAEMKFIGSCGLRARDDRTSASLGYFLAQPYWRRGLASEAAEAFIDVAFNRLSLVRVVADAEKGNAASERILEKFGFQFVSQEYIPHSGRTLHFYELSRATWEQSNISTT